MNQDQTGPVEEIPYPTEPETENIPRKETITVKITADCLCFVENCPLHAEAAQMFLTINGALHAAQKALHVIDSVSRPDQAEMDTIRARVSEVIAALELPLANLSERVVLR